ncbi:hypothetical protein FB451DRAFT_1414499 [Mycena latifolia]|nr:hypothetical protein FB451DRAFT_1414499 [Mycena latifolia]
MPRVEAVRPIFGQLRIIPEACPDRDSLIELQELAVFLPSFSIVFFVLLCFSSLSLCFPRLECPLLVPSSNLAFLLLLFILFVTVRDLLCYVKRRREAICSPEREGSSASTNERDGRDVEGEQGRYRPATRGDKPSAKPSKQHQALPDDVDSEESAASSDGSEDSDSEHHGGRASSPGGGVPETTSGDEEVDDETVLENRGGHEYLDPTLPIPRGPLSFVVTRDLSKVVLGTDLTIAPIHAGCPLGVREDMHPPRHYSIRVAPLAQFVEHFGPSEMKFGEAEEKIVARLKRPKWFVSNWGSWICSAGTTPEAVCRTYYSLRVSLDAFQYQNLLYRPITPRELPTDPYDPFFFPVGLEKPVFSFSRALPPALSALADGVGPSAYEAMQKAVAEVVSLHEDGQNNLEREARAKFEKELSAWKREVDVSREAISSHWETLTDTWKFYHEERRGLVGRTLRSLFQLGFYCRLLTRGEVTLPASAAPPPPSPSMFVELPARASSSKRPARGAADPAPPLIDDPPLPDAGDGDHSDSATSVGKKQKQSKSPQARKSRSKKAGAVDPDDEGEAGEPSTYDTSAWHLANDPFSGGGLFSLRGSPLNNRGWDHSLVTSPALARNLEVWKVLTKVLPGIVFFTRGPGCSVALLITLAALRVLSSIGQKRLPLLNAAYTDFVCDWFAEYMSAIAGVNINERMLARCLFRHQQPGYGVLGSQPVPGSSFAAASSASNPTAGPSTFFSSVPSGLSTAFPPVAGSSASASNGGWETEEIVERAASTFGHMMEEFVRGAQDIGNVMEHQIRQAASSPSKAVEEDGMRLEGRGTASTSLLAPRSDLPSPMDVSPVVAERQVVPFSLNSPPIGSPRAASPVSGGGVLQGPAPSLQFGTPVGLLPPRCSPGCLLAVPAPTSPRFSSMLPVVTLNAPLDDLMTGSRSGSGEASPIVPAARTPPRLSSLACSSPPPQVPSPVNGPSVPSVPLPPRPTSPEGSPPFASGSGIRASTPRPARPAPRAPSVGVLQDAGGVDSNSDGLPSPSWLALSPEFGEVAITPRGSRERSLASGRFPTLSPDTGQVKTAGAFVDLTGEDVEMDDA